MYMFSLKLTENKSLFYNLQHQKASNYQKMTKLQILWQQNAKINTTKFVDVYEMILQSHDSHCHPPFLQTRLKNFPCCQKGWGGGGGGGNCNF